MRPLLAEMVGTMVLTLVVISSLYNGILPTPVMASVTLGMMVYAIGWISGSHINPAVSFGLWWAGAINTRTLLKYVISQFAGAGVAYLLAVNLLNLEWAAPTATHGMLTGVGEILGTAILGFGVGSVVMGKLSKEVSGLVIGTSLLIGIVVAGSTSAGVLNPAVAMALSAKSLTYMISPLIGAIAGMQLVKILVGKN